MDALTPFETNVVRDDEWLFYGLPFSDSVWIDGEGNLHEGEVPASHENDQWGTGFFRRESRDAFMALWLEHRRKLRPLIHSGPPNLSFLRPRPDLVPRPHPREDPAPGGVGALPEERLLRFALPGGERREIVQGLRRRLLNPLAVSEGELPEVKATANGRLGGPGETCPARPAQATSRSNERYGRPCSRSKTIS